MKSKIEVILTHIYRSFILLYQMPKVFSGSQHIKILFKFGSSYKLTENIHSQDTYTQTYNNVIGMNKIDVIDTRLLKYQMVRNEKNKQLNTFAVFLSEVKAEPTLTNIGWSNQKGQIQKFVKAIDTHLPGLQVFAYQGSEVQLVK